MARLSLIVLCGVLVCGLSVCAESDKQNSTDVEFLGRQLIEEGRTFVHHVVKRFMIILPAIFFKLGVAFTLLLLVTVVAVNNGFIGFLILVVGLSSVLARLQEVRRPAAVPIVYAPHAYAGGHHHFLDKSDNFATTKATTKPSVAAPTYQTYEQNQDLRYTDVYYNPYGNTNQKL